MAPLDHQILMDSVILDTTVSMVWIQLLPLILESTKALVENVQLDTTALEAVPCLRLALLGSTTL